MTAKYLTWKQPRKVVNANIMQEVLDKVDACQLKDWNTSLKPRLHKESEFDVAQRSTYLRVDLQAIWNNIQILKSKCANHTKVIAVVKGNAYGHGSVGVARHLSQCGVTHFAVATSLEGKELRQNGVTGFIQVLGSCVTEEMDTMLEENLTPTVSDVNFIKIWAEKIKTKHEENIDSCDQVYQKFCVVVKVDSGMSRNGCQCEDLPKLMKACAEHKVAVHSLMTHFAQAWDDPVFTQQQLATFLDAVQPYRKTGVKVHVANSAAIIRGFGTHLDFVRPGIAIYGLPPDSSLQSACIVKSLGLKPALTWVARPSLVKTLEAGRSVGYDQMYKLLKPETLATFSFGYADGYNRLLSGRGVLTDTKANQYEVVGRVSMDAVTVIVDDNVTRDTVFHVITDDYQSPNCVANMAAVLGTIPYEVATSLAARLPRLYVTNQQCVGRGTH
ncbi:unnamed protein product [Lymnaea stagnalis]|uniref:Alanine racemase C-terminal domain-containing protein n=1 Tax=Lymnaea stagnalis TaxID=6523 RepID=A0AAV2H174_LYMST